MSFGNEAILSNYRYISVLLSFYNEKKVVC